ncbi:MAG TPA: D-alanyl-D-alanine carboxypeptidase/D-alanyl-D-alanine-endopeptidase, partial [Thermoanaerobaculia bacterium]|nr:D-alanyl-D-alanine carboxypeptidase/D-alanyl-D-alanine-endopeptidase [Thermoanaerobaculia bacterium]
MTHPTLTTLGTAVAVILSGCAAISFAHPVEPRASLADTIDAIIAAPPHDHAIWGIVVEDENGRVLYEHHAHTLLMPASNRKLFASATAAECLGLSRRLLTELWLDGTQDGAELNGDVVLKGGGDPSLGGRYAFNRDDVFAPFIAALRARGIRKIRGDVVADVSAFDRDTIPGSWKNGNLGSDYAAPVDALAYNENVVGVVIRDADCRETMIETDPPFVPATGHVTCAAGGEPIIRTTATNAVSVDGSLRTADAASFEALVAAGDPALYAAQALADSLMRAGIVVTGATRVSAKPRAWRERLAVIEGPPLYDLLPIVLKNSQNLYAEMLLKSLSVSPSGPASYGASLDIERAFLISEVGAGTNEFRFVDGSGLASDDLVTPAAIVKVLRWMNDPVRRGIFWSLLATPGEEGTLHHRLLDLAPRLRGKTGTINGVNALSAILLGRDGRYR